MQIFSFGSLLVLGIGFSSAQLDSTSVLIFGLNDFEAVDLPDSDDDTIVGSQITDEIITPVKRFLHKGRDYFDSDSMSVSSWMTSETSAASFLSSTSTTVPDMEQLQAALAFSEQKIPIASEWSQYDWGFSVATCQFTNPETGIACSDPALCSSIYCSKHAHLATVVERQMIR